MTESFPLVSIIIPVYNSEAFLLETLQSCLEQDYPALEVILIDDCSSDRSLEIAHAFRQNQQRQPVKVYQNEKNLGASESRNRAVNATSAEYVAFLDSDDLWLPQKISRQIAHLRSKPESDGILTHVQQFFTPGKESELASRYQLPNTSQPGFLPSALLMRKPSYLRMGGFSSQWRVSDGMEFFIRAEQHAMKFEILDETLVRRRIHGHNAGIERKEHQSEFPRLLKAKLDAARQRTQTEKIK